MLPEDIVRENRERDFRFYAELVSKEIDENTGNPDALSALKKVGRNAFDILPNIPPWAQIYWEKFKP